MNCQNCGQNIPDDSNFCPFCANRAGFHQDQDEFEELSTNTEKVLDPFNYKLKPKHRHKNLLPIILLCIAILGLLISNGYTYNKMNQFESEVSERDKRISSLKSDYTKLQNTVTSQNQKIEEYEEKIDDIWDESIPYFEKAYFMDEHIVIVGDDGSGLYHKYDCSELDLSYFWAFNTEAAIAQGYRKCTKCN